MTETAIKILATIGGLILTLIIFLLAGYQQWKSGGGAIGKALHGDIESLETIAYKLRNGRWIVRFNRGNTRKDIIHALCLAWSLELPPYTRALIFDALVKTTKRGNVDFIKKELDRIDRKLNLYQINFKSNEFKERLETNKSLLEKLLTYQHAN